MLMASDEPDYLFSVAFRRFGCTPHREAARIAGIPMVGRPLMTVQADHPAPSMAFVVLHNRQVGSGPGVRLKRVGHSFGCRPLHTMLEHYNTCWHRPHPLLTLGVCEPLGPGFASSELGCRYYGGV
jgi:hypothetical protein